MNPTKQSIIDAAYQIADEKGFTHVMRDDVATRAGVASGSVNYYYSNMDSLRSAVMLRAVEEENVHIIAIGLAARHPVAMSAPEGLRRAALETLM